MILSKENLASISTTEVVIPAEELFNLPEKVLQFGTGVLLRGLPDYFIDKANRQGLFNGRIVVVKSTSNGDTKDFDQQNNLYTIGLRGIEGGKNIQENIVCSAISRVIPAEEDWESVLAVAVAPDLQIVVSNTTEVGIQLVEELITKQPPASFPGKLLAVLYQRFKALGGTDGAGLVIIATELIPDNGKKLEEIVYNLATFNQLETDFFVWSKANNIFCNSLVDRIVPGKPDALNREELKESLGYDDQLFILAEPYRLWAVEGDDTVASVLSFMQADPEGLIVKPDIEIYRELKVRLLNGTHTLTCGIAFLSAIDTVKEAMDNTDVVNYVGQVMKREIAPAIPYEVSLENALTFAGTVIDRFSNPHIKHLWLSITVQYSMKMKIRVLPVLFKYYSLYKEVPPFIAFGFAAYLHFMRAVKTESGKYYGTLNGAAYVINDDSAAYFYHKTAEENEAEYATVILSDTAFWGANLADVSGFIDAVKIDYTDILENGITEALSTLNNKLKAVK